MRKTNVSIAVMGLGLAMALAGCGGSSDNNSSSSSSSSSSASAPSSSADSGAVDGKGAKVGIILPDTTSSPRWVTADPTALKAACQKAKADHTWAADAIDATLAGKTVPVVERQTQGCLINFD